MLTFLSVGPTDLTNGELILFFLPVISYALYVDTLTTDTKALIPTVTDNLYADHKIFENLLSVSFEPITTDNSTAGQINGELTWGVWIYCLKP